MRIDGLISRNIKRNKNKDKATKKNSKNINTESQNTGATTDASIDNGEIEEQRILDTYNEADLNIISKGSTLPKNIVYNQPKTLIFSENPYHINETDIGLINNYRGTLKYTASQLQGNPKDKSDKIVYDTVVSPSLFNPFYGVTASGSSPGVPLLDNIQNGQSISAIRTGVTDDKITTTRNINLIEIDDCSIKNLVRLSTDENSILGQAKYKYSDFMYCKELGRISNNHLITLRRFSAPIQDNIFQWTNNDGGNTENPLQVPGDIGRLVTWFGTDDNKIEDILKYTVSASWKELEAEIQEKDSQEAEADRGIVGGLVNLFNPKYNESTGKGIAPSALSLVLGDDASDAIYTSAPYSGNKAVNGAMYDQNKIYTPKDRLRSTNIYEGFLKFENSFSLTFNYKLRSYDNINPKAAFLDLLGNILAVTYKKGTFWPGEQRIIGAPQNKAGWNKAVSMVDDAIGMGQSFIGTLANGGSLKDATGAFMNVLAGSSWNKVVEDPVGTAKELLGMLGSSGIGDMFKGMIHNKLGRPAVYAFDSLLTQSITGLWHVTIGNPLNPIASMGNLIIENTEITHSGPLGLDDFPTELKVVVSLKHAMPRDSIDIQKMYTKGRHGIYATLSNKKNLNFPDKKTTSPDKSKPDKDNANNKETTEATSFVQALTDNAKETTKVIDTVKPEKINVSNDPYTQAWWGDNSSTRILKQFTDIT